MEMEKVNYAVVFWFSHPNFEFVRVIARLANLNV